MFTEMVLTDESTTERNGTFVNNTITRMGGNGIDSDAADATGGVLVENNVIYDVGGYAVTAHADDDDRLLGSQIGIGDATSGNFKTLMNTKILYSHRSCNDRFCRLCKPRLSHPAETLHSTNLIMV